MIKEISISIPEQNIDFYLDGKYCCSCIIICPSSLEHFWDFVEYKIICFLRHDKKKMISYSYTSVQSEYLGKTITE
jgi:hypothetical protein